MYSRPLSIQIWHIAGDYVGADLEQTSYAWKTMLDTGLHIAFGSDAPVISFNVMEGIYCAVTRKDLKGRPRAVGCRIKRDLSMMWSTHIPWGGQLRFL